MTEERGLFVDKPHDLDAAVKEQGRPWSVTTSVGNDDTSGSRCCA